MSLHMLHLPIRQRELLACGREQGLVRNMHSVDLGYLVHALLARALGERAAKPFDVQSGRAGETPIAGGLVAPRPLSVLAYSADDAATLSAHAQRSPPVKWMGCILRCRRERLPGKSMAGFKLPCKDCSATKRHDTSRSRCPVISPGRPRALRFPNPTHIGPTRPWKRGMTRYGPASGRNAIWPAGWLWARSTRC